ncbi:polysaccharide lyase 8 family protein [Micromonospora sp. DT81.3]|uniref:polysaccharide lyase 8 family protein n=1 Tax=Micromonospora sp. DT81.3 TaxID=3416523 RepID=UPI003CFAD64B
MIRSHHPLMRALLAVVLLGVVSSSVFPWSPPRVHAADSFADARQRWADYLTGGADFDPAAQPYADAVARVTATAREHWDAMDRTPQAELWADLSSATSVADTHESYIRLQEMTVAYATKGSALRGNPDLLASLLVGLDWLSANRYNTQTVRDTNTWYWALGIPLELNDITVLLYDKLGSTRIQSYIAAQTRFLPGVYTSGPYSTGANRAWSVMVVALRGVIAKDPAMTTQAQKGIVPVMQFVTTGDGYYERGGFIQHSTVPYAGGYGTSALRLVSQVMYLFEGSPWEVTDPATMNIYNAVRVTHAPFLTDGVKMDSVRGREISREYNQDRDAGSTTIRAIALLAESAPDTVARQLRSGLKRLLLDAELPAYQASSSIYDLELAAAVLNDPAVVPGTTPVGAFAFSSMDRFVHRAKTYDFAVSGSSSRITNFETANTGENQKAWYTGDGMTYLYTDDTAQYTGNYWATVNRYRLPGTTVDTRKKGVNDGRNYLSRQNFAGGLSSASGTAGAFGMILDGAQTNLLANKAWFSFDNEIVALGSGINDPALSGTGWDTTPVHVESIIDNRRLEAADQKLTVDGKGITSATAISFSNPRWAQLSGSRGQIGYTFPGAESLRAAKTSNAGSWFDINAKTGSTQKRTDSYFALWVNHGVAPSNATYSYVVLPNASTARTQSYAAAPETIVLTNTTAVSAVKETKLNAVGAVFWKDAPATVKVGGVNFLSASRKAVVMTEATASGISLTVTDPTQANTAGLTVTLNRPAKSVLSASPGVRVVQLSPTVIIEVATAGAAGAPFAVKLGY